MWDYELGLDTSIDDIVKEKLQGAAAIIMDAAYNDDEYHGRNGQFSKKGWGHGTNTMIAHFGKEIGAQRVFLTHHSLEHNDKEVDDMVLAARQIHPCVYGAQERMEFELQSKEYRRRITR